MPRGRGSSTSRFAVAAAATARPRRGQHGSVTAELALALPAVVLILAVVLVTGQVAGAQLRCIDAARAAARQAARGESGGVVFATARAAGPRGAWIRVLRGGATVTVSVDATVRLPMPGVPGVAVHGQAVADVEQP